MLSNLNKFHRVLFTKIQKTTIRSPLISVESDDEDDASRELGISRG